jgi:tetratricopeptide (TPR) repeat protein
MKISGKKVGDDSGTQGKKLFAFVIFPTAIVLFFLTSSCNSEARKEKKLMELFNQGCEYYDKEDYQKAYDCLTKCIEMDSAYVEFYENRGSMCALLNDLEGSKKDCEKGLSMDSCSKYSLQGMAEYYDEHNDHLKAVYYWERLIQCDSVYPFSYINYGISCYEAENYDKALSLFLKIKTDPAPYEYIGKIFNLQGDSISGNKFLKASEEITQKYGWDKVKDIVIVKKM